MNPKNTNKIIRNTATGLIIFALIMSVLIARQAGVNLWLIIITAVLILAAAGFAGHKFDWIDFGFVARLFNRDSSRDQYALDEDYEDDGDED